MSVRKIRSLVVLLTVTLLIGTVVATAAASPVGREPTRETKTVKGVVSHWSPTTVRISAGDTIRWKAVSGSHTVTAYSGNWAFDRSLSQGTTLHRRFTHAGTYRFRCTFHSTLVNGVCSGMCAKVVVTG